MGELEEIEAIKRLKYRYMRCVDLKLWDELRETFAPDARSAYGDGKHAFEGRDAIVDWLREVMEGNLITLHQVHHPEIELTSPTTAKGTWYLQDLVINAGNAAALMPANTELRGSAFYSDEYVKLAGEWKIQLTGYERVYEETLDRKDSPTLSLRSRWDSEGGGA